MDSFLARSCKLDLLDYFLIKLTQSYNLRLVPFLDTFDLKLFRKLHSERECFLDVPRHLYKGCGGDINVNSLSYNLSHNGLDTAPLCI